MPVCDLSTCKHVSDVERELAVARSNLDKARDCLREILSVWDHARIESIEDGVCPMTGLVGPVSFESLERWRQLVKAL
jgi:hypothetical protein